MITLLNTSFIMEPATVESFKSFIAKDFIPELRKDKAIKDIKFLNILNNPHGEEAKSFALQFVVEGAESLKAVKAGALDKSLSLLRQTFGERVLCFSTEMLLEAWIYD